MPLTPFDENVAVIVKLALWASRSAIAAYDELSASCTFRSAVGNDRSDRRAFLTASPGRGPDQTEELV